MKRACFLFDVVLFTILYSHISFSFSQANELVY